MARSQITTFRPADLWFRRSSRNILIQVLIALVVIGLIAALTYNAQQSLSKADLSLSFSFLTREAGFDVSQSLIGYTAVDSFGRAFVAGLLNTLLVASLGIGGATLIGLVIGIGTLQPNRTLQRACLGYVVVFRNVPLLLQLYFWYSFATTVLPKPSDQWSFLGVIVSRTGIYLPGASLTGDPLGHYAALLALFLVVAGMLFWLRGRGWFRALLVGLCAGALVLTATGSIDLEFPTWQRFHISGGIELTPEFLALFVGLSFYTASFIAETVRSGVLAVPAGQVEAAHALGLNQVQTLRRVVLPQALRMMIPPLTNQYLNLTKNSSLAVAIGYPDVTSIANSTLNITGRAVECIAIIMGTYLLLSLAISGAMSVLRRARTVG